MERALFKVLQLLLIVATVVGVWGAAIKPTEDHRWVVTQWSQCSASCGGIRVRSVYCVNSLHLVSDECQSQKPTSLALCNKDGCIGTGSYPRHMWVGLGETQASSVDSASTKMNSNQLKYAMQTGTVLLDWTVSEWSECSGTCGGGIRARSVRCLDECGIISQRCNTSKDSRPSMYQFCARINCITGTMDVGILPPNGVYTSPIPDGSLSVLDFMSTSIERYQISQNITESDGTLTLLMETARDGEMTFSCQPRSVETLITDRQVQGKNVIFINGEILFELDCVVTTIVEIEERVTYDNSRVTIQDRDIQFPNITTFWYCDSFRCYMFNSTKSSFERSGPRSKLFTSKDVALYSIAGLINSAIEDILLNPPPIIVTTSPLPSTSLPASMSATTPLTLAPTISRVTTTIILTSSISSVIPSFTTTQAIAESSTIAIMLPTPSLSVSTLIVTPSPVLTRIMPTSTTESEILTPSPTHELVTTTAIVGSTSPMSIPTPLTISPSPTAESTPRPDPTRDEICPRKSPRPKPKPKTKKKKRPSKPIPKTKTRDTGKTLPKSGKLKRFKKKGRGISKSGKSPNRTKCPPEETRDRITKTGTGKRTMSRKTASKKTTRRKSSKDLSISMPVPGPEPMTKTGGIRKTGNRISKTQSKESWSGSKKTHLGVVLVTTQKWWYCKNLEYIEELVSKRRKTKSLDSKTANYAIGKYFVEPSFRCKPDTDCTPDHKMAHKSPPQEQNPLHDKVFAVCQYNEEREYFICCTNPEKMEKFLHCQSGGYKEAFAKEQVSLVMVEKEDDWG